jgi:hypothetical protein
MTLEILRQTTTPMRLATIELAEQRTRARAASVYSRIASMGGDIHAAYPYPNPRLGDRAYHENKSAYLFAMSIVALDFTKNSPIRHHTDPLFVVPCDDSLNKVVAEERKSADEQFEAYLVKLAGKTGPVANATLHASGAGVWEQSTLVVTRPDGTTAVFITKRIINVSKLGKLFYQWPTRMSR